MRFLIIQHKANFVYSGMKRVALCIADTGGKYLTKFLATAAFGYVVQAGNRDGSYYFLEKKPPAPFIKSPYEKNGKNELKSSVRNK